MIDDPKNPFKGPHPLAVGDRIFGRTREIDMLLAQLVSNRVVLLHSVSGCGKTSLIDAGLRPRLKEFRLRGLPTVRIPRRTGSTGAPPDSLLRPLNDVLEAARSQTPPPATAEAKTSKRLQQFDVIIFDQFEEVLDASRVSEAERLEFFKHVGGLLADGSRWALFAMREDYLGMLEPYLRFLPDYLESRFRLTQLPIKDAETAITAICQDSGVTFQGPAAARLAADLATTEDVAVSATGPDTRLVEPVYLQVAGKYLWADARAAGRTEITVNDVATVAPQVSSGAAQPLVAVEAALQRYYDLAVAQATGDVAVDTTQPPPADAPDTPPQLSDLHARARKWFSEELIAYTPHGELRKQTLYAARSSAIDAGTLKKLEDTYIIRKDVRNGTWYELAHDRLVQPVLRSNRTIRSRSLQQWQAEADAWSQEGENRALLVLRGGALDTALRWAAANPKAVTDTERRFLDQCQAESRQRKKLKWYRRAAIAAAAVGAVAIVMALVLSAAIGTRAAAARAAAIDSEQLAAANSKRADEFARQATAAQSQLARANTEKAESAKQLASTQLKAALAEAQVRTARDLEERARRDAAAATREATVARNDAARLKIETETVRTQSAALVNAAQGEVALSSSVAEAYDALSHAQRDSLLGEAVSAAQKLTRQFGTAWTDRARQALTQSLETIQHLYSRNLMAQDLTTATPVLAIGLDPKTGCVQHLGETGSFAVMNVNSGRPCEQRALGAAADRSPFVTAQAISEDASTLVTGSATGEIGLIKAADRTPRKPFQGYHHEVMTAYVSPGGRYLASASSLWSFEVADLSRWPADDDEPKRVMRRPRAGIRGWFHWFRLFRGETTHTIDAFAIDEQGTTVERHGPVLAAARRDGAVELFDVVRQSRLLKIPGPIERRAGVAGHEKRATALAFDRRGVILASGGVGGEVLVWQLPPNAGEWRRLENARDVPPVASLRGCKDTILGGASAGGVTAITFSPDDRVLAVGCQTGAVLLYYLSDTFATEQIQPLQSLLTLVGQPTAMVFSPTSRRLIIGGSAARLEHWIVPTESLVQARQDVLKKIAAARQRAAATAASIDPSEMSAILSAIETAAPKTAEAWGKPRPLDPRFWK